MKTLQVGDVFPTNEGDSVTVIDITNNRRITVKYNDVHGHVVNKALDCLNKGRLKNPHRPSVYNIGYTGVGPHVTSIGGTHTNTYRVWKDMLKRCYCPKYHHTRPSYIECTVSLDWHNFQIFADWHVNNLFNFPNYQLDKDIIHENNKVYSANTCVLVPSTINNLFSERTSPDYNLPTGVRFKSGRYTAYLSGNLIGVFSSAEHAHHAYCVAKKESIYGLMYTYKYAVDIRVYYALYALANTL